VHDLHAVLTVGE